MMVATLLEADLAGVASAVRAFDRHADAFEVRLDAFERPPPPAKVRALTTKPLIATCRRPQDGGRWRGPESERLAALEAAAGAGFEFVDLEGAVQLPVPEPRVIRSWHDSAATPDADSLVRRGQDLGRNGARVKVATQCRSFGDTLALLEATRRLREAGLAASVMGLGDYPRALAPLLGSEFVYGGARANAPGQPPLADLAATRERWGRPGAAARLYLVVGSPVGHSLSPRLHNAAFRAAAVDAAYGALDVRTRDDLARLMERAAPLRLLGLSVTAPLKEDAYDLVARRTPEAQRARSVNTVRWEGAEAVGHNTDGLGARRVLERLRGTGTRPPRVLLVGTGGAARGLLAQREGYEFIVAGRNPAALRAIENEFGVGTLPLERCAQYLDTYDVLVNATAVQDPVRIDAARGALFDLHYGEEPTAWERVAAARGLAFAGGRELLLEQALPAFEFWTGRAAPRPAMAAALEDAP